MKPCKFINESIRFDINAVFSCCNNVKGVYIPICEKSDVNNVMHTFFEKTNAISNGIYLEDAECEGCYKTTEEYINSGENAAFENIARVSEVRECEYNNKIKTVYICHWRYCNINCIYCVVKDEKKKKNNYNVIPYLKWLKENNKLSDDFMICIGGGEPGILKEIDKILDWGLKNSTSYVSIMSNFVVFRNSYKKLLKNERFVINVSIDSGNKHLYKIIHNSDSFNKVINNVKKALKYVKNKSQILLKYIIIENYNDKEEFIDEFLRLSDNIGVYMVSFDFDRSAKNINNEIPKKILNLYSYAKNEAAKYNLLVDLNERTELMFNQKKFI